MPIYRFVMPNRTGFTNPSPDLAEGMVVEFDTTKSQYLTANPWRVLKIRPTVSIGKPEADQAPARVTLVKYTPPHGK